MTTARYAIGDLARLAGVSRRTVRYYVQEGLIPPPLGGGRGSHYGPEHLDEILRVKAMQEAGKTLDQIRRSPADASTLPIAARAVEHIPLERSLWRRVSVAPGVELHLAGDVRLPSPGKLQELAAWCRLHLTPTTDSEDEADDER